MDISIRTLFKSVLNNIYKHIFTHITIATLLQLVMLCGIWLVGRIFQFTLSIAGETNLNKNNILTILTNPLSLILLLLLILFVAFLMFIEFSALTFAIYAQLTEKNYSVRNIISNSWNKMRNLVSIQILFFIGYFILTIPAANIGIKSIITKNIYIPKFISSEIMKTNTGFFIWSLVIILFAYINLRLIFTLPLAAIGNKEVGASIRKSWKLTQKGKFKFLLILGLFELIYGVIVITIILTTTAIFLYIDPTGNNLIIQTLFFTVVSSMIFFFGVITKITVITSLITVLIDKEKISDKIVASPAEDKKKSKWLLALSWLLVLGITLYNGTIIYTNGVNNNIKTISHRGYISKAVENSIESLEAAAKAGSDYVEVDILLTKDNKFVVMHDYNLKRLAGINKSVQDMNYNEIVGLPIKQGEHRSRIPSFEEFVTRAKQLNIKLVVELKPHGGEPSNYIDILINKIKELHIEKEYKYMSLNLKIIEELETKFPELYTGYVIPLQLGNFSNNNVDFFVIEDFSYRDSLVQQARKLNKDVYVWTINDSTLISKYLMSPAAAIITDEPEIVKKEKQELQNNNTYLDRVMRLIDIRN